MYLEDTFSNGEARTVTYPTYLDRQTGANSVDPDQTPPNAATDLGLHCLHLTQQFLDSAIGSRMG